MHVRSSLRFLVALVVLLLCGLGFGSLAQKAARPNFSGVWLVETADQSQDLSGKDLIIERTRPSFSDIRLKISDDGKDIKVLRTFVIADKTHEQNLEYHTDGRGESNPAVLIPNRTFPSHTRWARDHLVIRFDPFTASVGGRPVVGRREVEWRLTENGTKLVETDTIRYQESNTIDSTVSASDLRQPSIVPPAITERRVYKKQS